MRSGGTAAKTGDQFDEQLENIAASVESSIDESSGRVSFSTLKERTDEVLAVFHDVVTAPAFREDKIDFVKHQLRSGTQTTARVALPERGTRKTQQRIAKTLSHIPAPLAECTLLINSLPMFQGKPIPRETAVVITPTCPQRKLGERFGTERFRR